jgi:hypothetical protein
MHVHGTYKQMIMLHTGVRITYKRDHNAQQHALQHTGSTVMYILRQNTAVKLLIDIAINL